MHLSPNASPDIARLLTLFARLVAENGFKALTPASVDEFVREPGEAVLFFAEDPRRVPESWDVAVVLPSILRLSARPLRVGLLDPVTARALAGRFGVAVWPSLVFTRDGEYLGCIERMQDWNDYEERISAILSAEPSSPPAGKSPPIGSAAGVQ